MPVLGWLAGRTFVEFIGSFDHWLAFGLLGFVGGRMIWESFHPEVDEKKTTGFHQRLIATDTLHRYQYRCPGRRSEFCVSESEYPYCQSDYQHYRFFDNPYRLSPR